MFCEQSKVTVVAYLKVLSQCLNQVSLFSENPKPSVILQTVKLPVVENEKCEEVFKVHAELGTTQMCVGGEMGYDSCGGDSGGPLMKVETLDGPPRYYLLGVVSFGAKNCGATTMPGVYTRISEYMNWIMNNMHAYVGRHSVRSQTAAGDFFHMNIN
jgi:secreted trypsin-like serine protease